MGKMMSIYQAYLQDWNEKHPSIVKPNTETKPNLTDAVVIARNCKFWSNSGYVYKLANGGICELSSNTAGGQIYATWDSEKDYQNYSEPQSFNTFFGQW